MLSTFLLGAEPLLNVFLIPLRARAGRQVSGVRIKQVHIYRLVHAIARVLRAESAPVF